MKKDLWLSSEVLEWHASLESTTEYDSRNWKRAYDIWSHAEQILIQPLEDGLYLVDAVNTLKRAKDHRLRILKKLYSFKSIPIKNKPPDLLEQMAYFGIIRPIMLRQLLTVRNEIEHQDVSPPKYNECKELLEFSWYFLRSTDSLARSTVSSFTLIPPEESSTNYDYWLRIETGLEVNWVTEVNGWLYPSLISHRAKDSFMYLKLTRIETQAEFSKRQGMASTGQGKNPEDIYINGVVRGPVDCLNKIFQHYFALL